jgi:hypothetical protein
MSGLPLGFIVEGAVAILLVLTIGYCIVLNQRLKRLHADKEMLRQMIGDLVQATTLANTAIGELRTTAQEAEAELSGRLDAATRVGLELSTHINAGQHLVEKIALITNAARPVKLAEPPVPEPSRVHSALQQLSLRPRIGGGAA